MGFLDKLTPEQATLYGTPKERNPAVWPISSDCMMMSVSEAIRYGARECIMNGRRPTSVFAAPETFEQFLLEKHCRDTTGRYLDAVQNKQDDTIIGPFSCDLNCMPRHLFMFDEQQLLAVVKVAI